MSIGGNFQILKGTKEDKDVMHITSTHAIIGLRIFGFIDKDTKQHIVYSPALEISGYGETKDKAEEMLKFSIDDFLQHLRQLSVKERDIELGRLGWKKSRFKNKDYSKVYVDIDGELKNFNAEEGTIQRSILQTA